MASITSRIETDEFIYVTQRGMANDRTPLYAIIKNIPRVLFPSLAGGVLLADNDAMGVRDRPQGRSPPGELEFRCVDLWREAFRVMDQG